MRQFVNKFSTTLAEAVADTDTTFDLTDATGLGTIAPGDYIACTIDNGIDDVEIIHITARSSNTVTCTRGEEGTSALTWVGNETIEARLTADALNHRPSIPTTNLLSSFEYFTDFTGSDVFGPWARTGSNIVSIDSPANHPGVVQLRKPASTVQQNLNYGRTSTSDNPGASKLITLGNGKVEIECCYRLSLLPPGGGTDNIYVTFFGLSDSSSGTPANALGISMVSSGSINPTYYARVYSSSSLTVNTSTTPVTPVVSTWTKFRIVINAAGTEALFYVDNTLLHTVSSGIPTGPFFPAFYIWAASGVTNNAVVDMEVDWFRIRADINRS